MHLPIDKKNKIYIYLVIFFLFTTISNLQISNSNLFKFSPKDIKVSGLSKKNNLSIVQELKKIQVKNIFFIQKDILIKILSQNNLVNSFEIKKVFPNTIEIKIKKTQFLGIINIDGIFYFIGSNGKLINYDESTKNLPYVFGKINTFSFIEFINIIKQSTVNIKNIKEIYFFPSGRWDIKTKEDKLFKLPSKNILSALNTISKLNNSKEFKKASIVDLRFNKKIIFTNE
jgi:cell division protein FtsQ|tara:strand:+ start:176 stop:862 length:687 start_codon:yes stop_codon:yes gene_type:complete